MSIALAWAPPPLGGMSLLSAPMVDSVLSFVMADSVLRREFAGYTSGEGGFVPQARNNCVATFLDKTDADWLLFVDWDITFTTDHVYALLDVADQTERPVVAGCYLTSYDEPGRFAPCWWAEHEGVEYQRVGAFEAGDPVKLTATGMGFTLIGRTLLEMMADQSDDPWRWFGHDLVSGVRAGEDVTFCRRAHAAGGTVWGHTGVLLGHAKSVTLFPRALEGGEV